ncbi:hypothetical protein SORBI_3010G200200, partial [Sorghum bicolor]
MQGGVIELAWQAAAAASWAERGTRGVASRRLPVRPRYRGVMRRGDMYVAEIMDAAGLRPVWLGSYATPEEAAYAYDAAARIVHGDKAKPNFPEPPVTAQVAGGGGGGVPAAHAGVLPPLAGHARVRAPLNGQQPAPPQAFYVQQAAAASTQHRKLPVSQASVSDQAVVGDNFTDDGASSSAPARVLQCHGSPAPSRSAWSRRPGCGAVRRQKPRV